MFSTLFPIQFFDNIRLILWVEEESYHHFDLPVIKFGSIFDAIFSIYHTTKHYHLTNLVNRGHSQEFYQLKCNCVILYGENPVGSNLRKKSIYLETWFSSTHISYFYYFAIVFEPIKTNKTELNHQLSVQPCNGVVSLAKLIAYAHIIIFISCICLPKYSRSIYRGNDCKLLCFIKDGI